MGEPSSVSPVEDSRRPSRTARRVRRFLGRSWQALLVAVVVLAVGVLAFLRPGLVRADVRLDEGTVHVAKQDAGALGVLNTRIDELSNSTTVGDSQFRILQDGHLVLVHGTESSTLMAYNPARNALESPVQLPSSATVQLAGGTLMVVNPDNGKVWFGDPDEVSKFDFQKQKARLEVGEFGNATVTADGDVIGLDIQRSVLVRPGDEGQKETPLPFTVDPDAASTQISAVGSNAVVLDRGSGRIWVEGMSKAFEVSGSSTAQLLAPAPDALGGEDGAKAIYATQAGLIAVTTDGPRSLTGNMDAPPVPPVQVGDCVYAAFGEQFVRACRGAEPDVRDIEVVPDGAELSFQVNRSSVVLNDVKSGVLWTLGEEMVRIDDWTRVTPPDETTDEELSTTETVIPPDRTQKNQNPVAKKDDLAARAGRSTILDVLDNDTDPDGDVLTITTQPGVTGATLQTVRGGTGLQITIDSEATGTLTFPYTISDGRRGEASAEVTVRILPADAAAANGAPYKHKRATPLGISLGQTITKRALMDWRDPDGDSLILVNASLPLGAEDEVTFTPDGAVTFRDIGKTTGKKKVNLKVSDGHTVTDGEMLVTVTDDVVAPIAYGDFETTAVGKTVTVSPLANDIGANLTLTEVDGADCGCSIIPLYREKVFNFKADKAGIYYVTYKVSNGPVAMGLVRIDVKAESTNHPPVAAVDVALLPPGGSVMIDPVLNDTDEDGDVLVVQSVTQEGGLQVELKRRHLVTITAQYALTEPVTLTYRLSDGKYSVQGTIVVIPTGSTTGSVQPQAEPDEVRIRAGATQVVDVLDNDSSPIGLPLTLDKLVDNPLGARAWIDRDHLRVAVPAGTQASSFSITYQVRDSEKGIASSRLRITVVSADAQNEPPAPQSVVERVLAGTTSRLILPVAGIDPNGDAVRLVGLGSGPTLGRVLAAGDGWLSYQAFPESQGTDVFSYQVIDSLGAIGTGEIRVGVAPAGTVNSAPTGKTDTIAVRPGRHVQIPALRNDVDIDGDDIRYASDTPVEIDGIEDIEIIENRDISFVAPEEPGTYTGTYEIEDVRGKPSSGELVVIVDKDAPLLPPEARDDVVPVSSVVGKDWVDVDVTANDLDPDGRQEDLRVEVPEYGAEGEDVAFATDDGRRITAPVTEHMQQIRYDLVDSDGRSATGLILMPGRNDSVPVLKDPALHLEAVAGQVLSIDINAYVAGTAGRIVRLVGADTVSATHGNALPGTERVEYTPTITYEGPASVVFEVIDVVNEGDKTAKSAYISIPVEVAPAPNRPDGGNNAEIAVARTAPELIGNAQPVLKVGPGEGEARLDLLPLFHDADGDSFFFTDFSTASGDKSVQWRASDEKSKIFASTSVTTPPGTVLIINAWVVDANDARNEFQVRVEVTSSTRPLATVVADDAVALAGQEVPVDVLLNDKSNLLEKTQLTLKDAGIVSGSGTARVDGDRVMITPAAGFVGTLTARYTVMDATEDPGRRVDGIIRVTVKDKPSRPGAPRDAVVGNGTVTFTYTAGSSNGFDVTSRTAVSLNAAGGQVQSAECQSTTCTMTNLPNGQPYTFYVVETNQAGTSDKSPLSAAYTPDVKPNAPAKPVVEFGDKQLTVQWQAPTWENERNPGSPVDRYTLALLDEAGVQKGLKEKLPANATSHTWTGLENGKRYRFRVMAGNKAGDSPFSEMSDVEWPAGPPSAPTSIAATATQNPLGGAFEVVFAASSVVDNGDPVRNFVVTPITDSGEAMDKAKTVAYSGAASQSVLVEGLGQQRYKFKVTAENKAGRGTAATTADWQVAWELPKLGPVSSKVGEGTITVAFTSNFEDRPAAQPVKEYQLNGGGWQTMPADGGIGGLTNGKSYDVSVRVRIDGGRASAPTELPGLMPKTVTPRWPVFQPGSFYFKGQRGGLVVVLAQPNDRIESGGWDPAGYQFRCPDQCTVGAWTGSNSLVVPTDVINDGTTVAVEISHRDNTHYQTTAYQSVQAPFRAVWDRGSRSFNFTLRYVRNASCTLTASSTTVGVPDFVSPPWNQGGGTSLSPDPIALPEGVSPSSVSLACKADSFQETFRVS